MDDLAPQQAKEAPASDTQTDVAAVSASSPDVACVSAEVEDSDVVGQPTGHVSGQVPVEPETEEDAQKVSGLSADAENDGMLGQTQVVVGSRTEDDTQQSIDVNAVQGGSGESVEEVVPNPDIVDVQERVVSEGAAVAESEVAPSDAVEGTGGSVNETLNEATVDVQERELSEGAAVAESEVAPSEEGTGGSKNETLNEARVDVQERAVSECAAVAESEAAPSDAVEGTGGSVNETLNEATVEVEPAVPQDAALDAPEAIPAAEVKGETGDHHTLDNLVAQQFEEARAPAPDTQHDDAAVSALLPDVTCVSAEVADTNVVGQPTGDVHGQVSVEPEMETDAQKAISVCAEPAGSGEVVEAVSESVAGTGESPSEVPPAAEDAAKERSVAEPPASSTETSKALAAAEGASQGDKDEHARMLMPQIDAKEPPKYSSILGKAFVCCWSRDT